MRVILRIRESLAPLALILGLTTTSSAEWNLVDNFESGFSIDGTVDGVNGWVAGNAGRALAKPDPLAASNGITMLLTGGAASGVYKALGANISEGSTGTLYYEIFMPEGGSANHSMGLSDSEGPNGFGSFKPQMRMSGANQIAPRDGGVFVTTGFEFDSGVWIKIWIVVDHQADTMDVYMQSPSGFASRVLVAENFGFRAPTNTNDLINFFAFLGGTKAAHVDNIYIDNTGENLSSPLEVDTDLDTLDDILEEFFTAQVGTANLTDLTTPWDGSSSGSGSGDFDGDGVSDFDEFDRGMNPVSTDTDGDTLLDGDELSGASNVFDGMPTLPTLADTDGDGIDDLQENGSLNGLFANAATNPNLRDTDGDGMDDGYELANNHPETALDPNDNGTIDASQGPNEDRDGDGLDNFAEYNPLFGPNTMSVRTRADLPDTDGDGLTDLVEDNFGSWSSSSFTGSNPLLRDTDDDGLLDNEEVLDLAFSSGAIPTNSDPSLRDTDFDGFLDSAEVDAGTNPNDTLSIPLRAPGFTLLEDFEGEGMVIGSSFVGVNGWVTNSNAVAIVADEPIEGGDQVGGMDRFLESANPFFFKSLETLGLQVQTDATATLFFQVYGSELDINHSLGLSDVISPGALGDYEAQAALVGGSVRVRDAGVFRDVASFSAGTWMNVWIVADNQTDTVKVYVESPAGEAGQIDVTSDSDVDPYDFRNGTDNVLRALMLSMSGAAPQSQPLFFDNFYIDPTSANLSTPAPAKPVSASGDLKITSVGRAANGDLEITFSPGGTGGYVLTSAGPAEVGSTGFSDRGNYAYDSVDTFIVPAAFVNANPSFFFRVEEE